MEYPMTLSISLTINGQPRAIDIDDPRVTLLDLLREPKKVATAGNAAPAQCLSMDDASIPA
jgi:aerobic-type carbon monoxide dehydrogenase small subunit (CoxS/CutS family)